MGSGDLLPLSRYVLEKVYGNLDYVESEFGTVDINRFDIYTYYNTAKEKWLKVENVTELMRPEISTWTKTHGLRGLDYYFPAGRDKIWFRNPEDGFAFKLTFGLV